MHKRHHVFLLLCLWIVSAHGARSQSGGSAEGFNGRWQAGGVPGSPWTFDLIVVGNTVTGRAMQNGGEPGPIDIYDGTIEGNQIVFKCKSPDGGKIITFTGRANGGDIAFTRAVEILPDGPIDNTILGAAADTGAFGSRGLRQFTARHMGPVPGPSVPVPETPAGPVNPTGRWENVQWNLDMWIFELTANGTSVTGNVLQRTGPSRQGAANPAPVPIFDGKVDRNTVTFKSRSPMGARIVTFTGKMYGDEIDFTRTIEIPPNGDPGGNAIYGAYARQSFVVRRSPNVAPPVSPAQNEMAQAQAKWSTRTLHNYEFTITWKCLCPLPETPLQFRATDFAGTVDLASISNQAGIKPVVERYGTFEEIFELIRTMALKQPYRMKVDYDPLLGYPVSGEINPGGISADDNIEFRVTGFRNLDALAGPPTTRRQDTYAIYSQLVLNDAKRGPFNTNGDTNILIGATTVTSINGFGRNIRSAYMPGPFDPVSPGNSSQTCIRAPGAADRASLRELQEDYGQRKDASSVLDRELKLDKPYQFLSDSQIAEFMRARAGYDAQIAVPNLPDRNALFMGARKLFLFGEVYFNANRMIALVYSSVQMSGATGTGGWKVFARELEGQWTENRNWGGCGWSAAP